MTLEALASAGRALAGWLSLRLPPGKLGLDTLAAKAVPLHRFSWVYNLGGLALCAFAVQVASGLMLMLYYQPTTQTAFQSVRFIEEAVPAGSLVRNMHIWSSHAMMVFMFAHAATVALTRAYRPPRELTWVTGVLSLIVVFALAFSGYLLPWNTLSVYATRVGTEIIRSSTDFLPGAPGQLGPFASDLLTGGGQVGQEALSRFFALHVAVLPLALAALLVVHLALVQVHGMSVPPGEAAPHDTTGGGGSGAWSGPAQRFFPGFALKEAAIWLLYLSALIILARLLPYETLLPYTLTQPFEALAPAPAGIKPEWYFYFLYYPLELLPRSLVIATGGLFFLFLLLAPWLLACLPRLWGGSFQASRFPTLAAAAVIAALFAITFCGHYLVSPGR